MQSCRILIVEDELLVAADLEMSLTRAGHRVVGTAENYADALRLTSELRPELVVMDIRLRGERSGILAASAIREHWQIPVVFLTANADQQTLDEARSAGPYGFLTKPFRTEELVESVRIAIAHHQSSQHLFAAQRWLTTVLDSLTDAVIATDAEARVRYLNPAAETLTGWTPIEANGRAIDEVYPLYDLQGVRIRQCLLKRSLASGEFIGRERFHLGTRTGARIPIEDSAAPILEGTRIVGAVTIFVDISDALSSERMQEIEKDRLEEAAYVATEALGQTRHELRALSADLIRTQEQEAYRMARELHDDLGQQAAVLSMLAGQIVMKVPGAASEMAMMKSLADRLAANLRRVSHALHPAILADLGLSVALENLVNQECELGRNVCYTSRGVPEDVPLEPATALYRMTQEALRNAAKHARDASVRVSLICERNELRLRIEDTGPGFSPIEARGRHGVGLINMQERARLTGGNMLLSTRPGAGTVLLIRVPLGDELEST